MFAAVSFLILAVGCMRTTANAAEHERVYLYTANSSLLNPASPDTISLWSWSARLTLQLSRDKTTVKLDDLKSFAYNGVVQQMRYGQFKPSKVTEDLSLPFVMNYENEFLQTISVEPHDSLWSVNIKRAIASILQVNFNFLDSAGITKENTLYGRCETQYTFSKDDNDRIIKKSVNSQKCHEQVDRKFETKPETNCPYFRMPPLSRSLEYTYRLGEDKTVKTINTRAAVFHYYNIKYETTLPYHISYQNQSFELLSSNTVEKAIDVSSATVTKNITYEHGDDATQGRRTRLAAKTTEELVSQWMGQARGLLRELAERPGWLQDRAHHEEALFDVRRTAEQLQDERAFAELWDAVNATTDRQLKDLWLTVLPTVGTRAATLHILHMCNSDDLSQLDAVSLLGKLPFYLRARDQDTLRDLEALLNLDNASALAVRNTGVISFSNVVSELRASGHCGAETHAKYVDLYLGRFRDSPTSNSRFIYLQGLHNLEADVKLLTPIIRNRTESPLIRSLAIGATKYQLRTDPERAFRMFWPMVKEHALPFQVRVAALDAILAGRMTEEQFLIIYDYLREHTHFHCQHLYSYFYTVFQNMDSEATWPHHLMKFAKHLPLDLPRFAKLKQTGLYREGHYDRTDNAGTFFESQVLEDPETDRVQTLRLQMNQLGLGRDYASFAIRISLSGIWEDMFIRYTQLDLRKSGNGPDLVKTIIQGIDVERNYSDATVDVLVYSGRKVLFALNMNERIRNSSLFIRETLQNAAQLQLIQYPVADTWDTPSDLGTPLSSRLEIGSALSYEIKNFQHLFNKRPGHDLHPSTRHTAAINVTLRSYNPVDDVFFSASKYYRSDKSFSLPLHWKNSSGVVFTWNEKPDTHYFHLVQDSRASVRVERADYLHKFCAICDSFIQLPPPERHLPVNSYEKLLSDSIVQIAEREGYSIHFSSRNCPHQTLLGFLKANIKKPAFLYRYDYMLGMAFWKTLASTYFNYYAVGSCSYEFFVKSAYSYPVENTLDIRLDPAKSVVQFYKQNPVDGNTFYNLSIAYALEEYPDLFKKHKDFYIYKKVFEDEQKGCLKSTIQFPPRSVDIFQMKPLEPAHVNATFSWGKLKSDEECPDERTITYTGRLSVLDEYREGAEDTAGWPFRECAQHSKGFKYLAPSEECYAATRRLTVYQNVTLHTEANFDLKSGQLLDRRREIDLNLLFSERFNNQSVAVSEKKDRVVITIPVSIRNMELTMPTPYRDLLYYNEITESVMHTSYCVITPDRIRTFGGHVFGDYEPKFDVTKVGYVECDYNMGNALLFSRVQGTRKNEMAFQLYTSGQQHDHIIVAPSADRLNVTLNGESVDGTVVNDHFSVTYLADDFIHIKSKYQDVYYNREYILVTVDPLHLFVMCGICRFENENFNV